MSGTSTSLIDVATLQSWLADIDEIALLDTREAGLFGAGHALLAVNVPYSRLELDIAALVPRLQTRIVLIADDNPSALRAAVALRAVGYDNLSALDGGAAAWQTAGQLVVPGVNVPSKAFAEFVERHFHTPEIQPAELAALQRDGADLALLDSRTVEEYRRFHVPGAVACPGSELPLRFDDLVPSPGTLVVISCAGRTRGVMGAQTLINAGVPNRVLALAGGTQGWRLAGLPLTPESSGEFGAVSDKARLTAQQRAEALRRRFAVPALGAAELAAWRADVSRTTFVFDVRTEAEYLAGHLPGARWAQGVQLIQCLDQFAGVRQARLVLVDDDGTRATATAHWLRQMGWDASVLQGAAALLSETGAAPALPPTLPEVTFVDAAAAAARVANGARLVDASASANYRRGHPAQALWGNRSALDALEAQLGADETIVLADDDRIAQLLAAELAPGRAVAVLRGGPSAWSGAGLPFESTPDQPADAARIDFLFWLHDRHEGNAAASAAYLEWEAELPDTLGPTVAGFRLAA